MRLSTNSIWPRIEDNNTRPGKNDIPLKNIIFGIQLDELQKHTWHMCEAFGLDRKIGNYKGARPITFYQWDLECLIDVLRSVLLDEKEYPNKKSIEYIELNKLYVDLKNLYITTYE